MKNIYILLFVFISSLQPVFAAETITNTTFANGVDVSWLTQMEAGGRKFYNAAGTQTECMALLKSIGMNSIRLRVWVNPTDGWCNAQDMLIKAIRANNLGMRIMIDFQYSDSWADPSNQTKPAAWSTLSFADLKTAVATHTTDVLNQLKVNNITPEWVQVGNETSNGMLWEDGKASTNMANYAALTNAGYNAVKAVFPTTKVVVHINNAYNISLFQWIFKGLKDNGGKWDVIGMSVYPPWYTTANDWANCNIATLATMNNMVSTYGCEVMVVECGMSWDSPAACKSFLTDLIAKTKSVSGGKGTGVFYWEPESYLNYSNYSLGAFDNSGKPTIALDAFKTQTETTSIIDSELKYGWNDTSKTIDFNYDVTDLKIINASGTSIIEYAYTKQIDLTTLQKGIYIIQATKKENNKSYTFKFIKN